MSNYYFDVGTWDKYYREIPELTVSHFNCVRPNNMPEYNPDENLYGALGAAGLNAVIVLIDRGSGKIKGYASCTQHFHPHYKDVPMAMIEAFYLDEDYGKANRSAGRHLLEAAEHYIKEVKGIDLVQISSGVNKNIGKWLCRKGYEPLEMIYVKRI